MIDSGCTSHVTFDKRDFISYHDFPIPGVTRTAGKSQTIEIKGHGTIALRVIVNGELHTLLLHNALYVPQATDRFFAPRVPIERGHHMVMDHHQLVLYQHVTKRSLFIAKYDSTDRLYWLEATIMTRSDSDTVLMSTKSTPSIYNLWHQRFGHTGKKSIEKLPENVKGVPESIPAPMKRPLCNGCEFGKLKRVPFPHSESRAEHLLDLIHMDLVEYPTLSIDGYKYTLTILDDHTSLGLTWFLKRKSRCSACL